MRGRGVHPSGIVLSDRALHRLLPDGSHRSVPLEPPLRPGDDPGPALHRALAALEAGGTGAQGLDAGERGGHDVPGTGRRGSGVTAAEDPAPVFAPGPVAVSLLPPLVEGRFVILPPLRPHEARAVLRRDAARHFVSGGRGSGFVAVGPHDRERRGRFAVFVADGLAEPLLEALRVRGYDPVALVAAHGGWALAGAEVEAPGVAVEMGPAPRHLLELDGNRILRVRRWDLSGTPPLAGGGAARYLHLAEPAVSSAGPPSGPMTGGGGAGASEGARGSEGARVGDGAGEASGSARETTFLQASLQAAEASPEEALAFHPPSLQARARLQERLELRRLGVAAVLLLLVAGALHGWGVARALSAVEEARRHHAQAVAPALVLRDSLDRMEDRLLHLRGLEAETARWSFPLVELSMLLPPETHLTGLRLAGDTLAVDGQGGRAGELLQALRSSTSFVEPLLEGSIQRTLDSGGGEGGERYTVSTLLRRPGGGIP